MAGESGLLNAPTGSGKTYAMGLPPLVEAVMNKAKPKGIQLLWITPVRALATEIKNSLQLACNELGLDWTVELRTGDTSSAQRAKQKRKPPEVLITTPESLHLLIAQKGYTNFFADLKCFVVDEWHELVGNKRGVQVELALSRLRTVAPTMRVWGISATVGNLPEAMQVLMGNNLQGKLIVADINKKVDIVTILPDEIETYPWAGHLGLKLLYKVVPIIEQSQSTLVFTNTRNQAENWYRHLLEAKPEWAGIIALHHGSLSAETRAWVENALDKGQMKVVVCTSSLDLGVDFKPVETVIQIGSPKGVSRFAQRAGRSGHQPGKTSRIYLMPTNALELIEAAGFKQAFKDKKFEARPPVVRAFDVLIQYLVTLAVGDGFFPNQIKQEVLATNAYATLNDDEWATMLTFIRYGGDTLKNYDDFAKVEVTLDGLYQVTNKGVAMRHRFGIGTITGDNSISVEYMNGKRLGSIEEYFVSGINPGTVFFFSGLNLELLMVREMKAIVRKAKKKAAIVPAWQGGRMPLSSEISYYIREKISNYTYGDITDYEMEYLIPLFEKQQERSAIPNDQQFLVEVLKSKEGTHAYFYPFEGRLVHEGMAMLLGYRLSKFQSLSFSIAMNDYGFELLTDKDFNIAPLITPELFSTDGLLNDIYKSTNYSEIARRRFRDIAHIAGLVFRGYPGKAVKTKHLQASSNLFYEVFNDYDKNNLLLKQALEEALYYQLEEERLRAALKRIAGQELILKIIDKPTPFSFPILVDRLREKMSTESIEDRVAKLIKQAEKKK